MERFDSSAKGKIVYHSGNKVVLNGKITFFAGVDWYIGHWIEGSKNGKECVISVEKYNEFVGR